MPKHKLNLNPAEELVQIDDTGPEVDVELSEEDVPSFEAVTPSKPVLENNIQKEDKTAFIIEDKSEDEHEEYSKGVKKRIDKLTAKLREAERRESVATQYAQNVHIENSSLKQQKQNVDSNYIIAEANRITAETEATKGLLKRANEEANTDQQVEAQQKLAALAVEAQRVQALNQNRAAQQVSAPPQYEQDFSKQNNAPVRPDPKAEAWAEGNPWFGDDKAMTMTSFVIHQDLLGEGFDANSNEYYSEVDKRIRDEFPHKFGDAHQNNRPAQAVAPAKRSAKTGRRSVRLTPSQVAIAKKLGVPLDEYAKYVD